MSLVRIGFVPLPLGRDLGFGYADSWCNDRWAAHVRRAHRRRSDRGDRRLEAAVCKERS